MSCVPPICPIRAGLARDFDAAFHTIEPHGHSMREGVSRCLTAIFRIIVPEYAQSLYDGGRCESLEPISADGGPARNAKIAGDSECSFYSFGNAHFLRWRRKFNVAANRSEEHTSELQSLMRISYAVFCLKKKTQHKSRQ